MFSFIFPKTARQKQRTTVLFIALSIFFIGCILTIYSLKNFIVYYYTPSEIVGKVVEGKRYRIGGIVKGGSVQIIDNYVTFILAESLNTVDDINTISVKYSGTVPSLFKEGSGAIAEGVFGAKNILYADNLLAKHDETYQPPNS